MVYTIAWDETTPAGTEAKSLGDNRIREFKSQIRERLDTEHTTISDNGGDEPLMHAWALALKSSGSPYTATSSDHVLIITTGLSDYTINLPTASGIEGKPYKIKKADSAVGTVIIDAYGSETIDGSTTFTLYSQNDFVDIVSDGTNWSILSKRVEASDSVPVGTIVAYGGSTPPTGWFLCTGAAISETTYSALFAVIGHTFGDPGGGNFYLPDLRQKFPLGKAASGTGSVLGGSGGYIDHTHTVTLPGNDYMGFGVSSLGPVTQTLATSSNNPPFLVINYIIKYRA